MVQRIQLSSSFLSLSLFAQIPWDISRAAIKIWQIENLNEIENA